MLSLCTFTCSTGESSGCGITEKVVEWMERIQNSGEPETPVPPVAPENLKRWRPGTETPVHKYSKEANVPADHWIRTRRATRPKEDSKKKNTCFLFIQTDPLIWRHIFEQVQFFNSQHRTIEVLYFILESFN
jgi:disintegrin and metalloproteinase domain-containing protein 10